MVTVHQGEHDRRVRTARLTAAGLAERALLDRRAAELAASLLTPLTAAQRERLVGAMRDVERLLTAAMVEIVAVDPEHPDARQCLRSYFAELERRSGAPFDPLVGSTAEPAELRPPDGEMVVAYLREEPVGCGALKHFGGGVTDIKRMWLAEAARGLGLGRRLLETLEQRAADAGARTVRLETSDLLVEAVALYRSAGYREVPAFNDEPFAHHWFAKRCWRSPRGRRTVSHTFAGRPGMAAFAPWPPPLSRVATSPSDTARATPPSTRCAASRSTSRPAPSPRSWARRAPASRR